MAGFVPDQGKAAILKILLGRNNVDRDADLRLGLFTNQLFSVATALADLVEPSGTGYARAALTDASWTITTSGTYAERVFTGGAGGWSPETQGYFICTVAGGGTPQLLFMEPDRYQTLAAGAVTRSGATVTVNTPVNHLLSNGDRVNVRGATQPEYNGIQVITVVDADTFTYTIAGAPVSPATGIVTVNRSSIINESDNYRITPNINVGS